MFLPSFLTRLPLKPMAPSMSVCSTSSRLWNKNHYSCITTFKKKLTKNNSPIIRNEYIYFFFRLENLADNVSQKSQFCCALQFSGYPTLKKKKHSDSSFRFKNITGKKFCSDEKAKNKAYRNPLVNNLHIELCIDVTKQRHTFLV